MRMVSQGLLLQEKIKPDPTLVLSPEVEKEVKERARSFLEKYNFFDGKVDD